MNAALGSVPSSKTLLGPGDPQPVCVYNESGRSPFLLLGDHAGNILPESLGTLGLDRTDRERHIAWDIGIGRLGPRLADSLDSVFIHQPYSRLVVDCNRHPESPGAVVETSDETPISGNRSLKAGEVARRIAEIHAPYHRAIAAELDVRAAESRPTLLVSLHSFTPSMSGASRPWQVGVLHDAGENRFAALVLAELRRIDGLCVGDNQPYQMDGTDYTVPFHAYPRGLPYVELEVRQDLLGDERGASEWCAIVQGVLKSALAAFDTAE